MSENELQPIFLNLIVQEQMEVTVFLMNGVRLQGIVESFDHASLLLKHQGRRQLVLKHAISTIMPANPIVSYDEMKKKG